MVDGLLKKDSVNKKKAYLIGAVVGVLVTFIMMLVFASILVLLDIDRAYATPFATISIAFGSFIASRIAARKIGDKGYFTGLIIGAVVFIVITAISLFLGNSLSLNTLFHFIIIMLSSLAGGISGVNKKTKKLI